MKIKKKGTTLVIVLIVDLLISGGIEFFSALKKVNSISTIVTQTQTQLSNRFVIGLLEANY